MNRNETILNLRTQGKSLQAIGDSLGISRQRVLQILDDLDYNHDVYLTQRDEQIKYHLLSGKTISQIMDVTGLSRHIISGVKATIKDLHYENSTVGKAIKLRNLKHSYKEIADILGITLGSVRGIMWHHKSKITYKKR